MQDVDHVLFVLGVNLVEVEVHVATLSVSA